MNRPIKIIPNHLQAICRATEAERDFIFAHGGDPLDPGLLAFPASSLHFYRNYRGVLEVMGRWADFSSISSLKKSNAHPHVATSHAPFFLIFPGRITPLKKCLTHALLMQADEAFNMAAHVPGAFYNDSSDGEVAAAAPTTALLTSPTKLDWNAVPDYYRK